MNPTNKQVMQTLLVWLYLVSDDTNLTQIQTPAGSGALAASAATLTGMAPADVQTLLSAYLAGKDPNATPSEQTTSNSIWYTASALQQYFGSVYTPGHCLTTNAIITLASSLQNA